MSIYSSIREGVIGHDDPTQHTHFDYELVEDNRYFVDVAYGGSGYIRLAVHEDPYNKIGEINIDKARLVMTYDETLKLIENLKIALSHDGYRSESIGIGSKILAWLRKFKA